MARSASAPSSLTVLFGLSILIAASCPAFAGDLVALGSERVLPGETAMIPIYAVDASATALGGDQALDLQIQGLSIGVRPNSSFASAPTFVAAGPLASLTPLVETTVTAGGTTSWVTAFHPVNDPVSLPLDTSTVIGMLSVPVSASTPLGTVIDLQLAPAFTAFSNAGGTVMLNGSNNGLTLTDGSILVESTPLFEDSFESGDVSAWSASFP